MKTYTIEFDLGEGDDEFWESEPTPEQVLDLVFDELDKSELWLMSAIKITKIVDNKIYEGDK